MKNLLLIFLLLFSYPAHAGLKATSSVNANIAIGSTFTIASGCSAASALIGGSTAGEFTTGAACTAPVINLPTAPNGWQCYGFDQTTGAHTVIQTANTASSCTLTITSAGVTDIIIFSAMGF